MKTTTAFLLFSATSLGCQSTTTECDPSALQEEEAALSIDAAEEAFTATWMQAGSSLQISLESPSDDTLLTIRLQRTDDGLTSDDLSAETSYSYQLGSDGGSLTYYPAGSAESATTNAENSGQFTLQYFDNQRLAGCFEATVTNDQPSTVDISGTVNATAISFE